MLIGRAAERARIEQLLAGAREGQGFTLVLRGEPGIGKSALLEHAAQAARGFLTLSTAGIEAQATGSFGGLAELFRPVADRRRRLPKQQARALSAALDVSGGEAVGPAAVSAAAFALAAGIAEERPLLLAIDDLPWLDEASRDAVLFLSRRSDLGGYAVIAAARDDGAVLGLPELWLGGLAGTDAEDLIRSAAAVAPRRDVVTRILDQTGGNPLALREVARIVSAGELSGTRPLEHPLPAGERVEQLFARRIAQLDGAAQTAILTAAASDRKDAGVLFAAAESLGADRGAFERAEAGDVLRLNRGEVVFGHPLLRSVSYERASPARRREVHAALALVEADPERRARHLAAAATGPDEGVVAALELAAASAQRRGALSCAAESLALAVRLSATPDDRAVRLLGAAQAAQMAGHWRAAIEFADEAIAASEDPCLQADAAVVKAFAVGVCSRPEEQAGILVTFADRVREADPQRALRLRSDAVGAWFFAMEYVRALDVAEGCRTLIGPDHPDYPLLGLTLGNALAQVGRAAEAIAWQAPAVASIESVEDLLGPDMYSVGAAWTALVHMEEYDRARRLAGRMADQARRAGALAVLSEVLDGLATIEITAGEWPAAAIAADELIRLAGDLDQPSMEVWGRLMRAEIAAAQGDEVEREAQLSLAAELAGPIGLRRVLDFESALARGRGLLAAGEYELAASTLGLLEDLDHSGGGNFFFRWMPDRAEALVRAGRVEDAQVVLAVFEQIHADGAQSWAAAAAARLQGLLGVEGAFETALTLGEQAGVAFETARTALCYGERLRRVGERRRARALLTDALATFVRLGARPWAQRAQAELRATGVTHAAHRAPDTPLTPAERQVAELVAEGLSNREIASRLFVSVRTVEMHISHAYRKLGIRSRTGLARRVLADVGARAEVA